MAKESKFDISKFDIYELTTLIDYGVLSQNEVRNIIRSANGLTPIEGGDVYTVKTKDGLVLVSDLEKVFGKK